LCSSTTPTTLSPLPEIQDALEDADIEFLQSDIPKMLSSMEMGTDRIRQIVLSLRNFSRWMRPKPKPLISMKASTTPC
jgi:two-component system NtrC family sensor kinase